MVMGVTHNDRVYIGLLMFVNGEIKEHLIQPDQWQCLRGKREAERQYSESVSINAISGKAELEDTIDGQNHIKRL